MNPLARLLRPLAWLLVAVLLSLGGAGVIARADTFPGDASRPELTWRYDRAMAPGIATAGGEARRVAAGVDRLGETARSALVDLLAANLDLVAEDLARGGTWIDEIERRAGRVAAIVAGLPYVDAHTLYGSGTRTRVEALRRVSEAVAPLRGRWAQLEQATIPAMHVASVLQAHDATVFEATQAGVREDYRGAIAILSEAYTRLDEATTLRDALGAAVDVSTLSAWIERSRVHDEALEGLYRALRRGEPAEIEEAVKKQKAAEALLPPDTRALVVILGDVALGGVSQAAVAIEGVRGSLGESIAALD